MTVKSLHIEFVEVETPPLDFRPGYVDGEVTQEEFLVAEYRDLPEQYLSSLSDVTEAKDTCLCWACETSVGYVLFDGDEDEPSGLSWVSVFLVSEDGGPVAVLCGDCFPSVPQSPYGGE